MPIAKLKTGKGARGLMRYLQEGKSKGADRVTAWESNLGGEQPEHWAMYFRKQAATAPQVEKPYLHLSVSFDPNDPKQAELSDDEILAFGKSYLTQMWLEGHQWVMAVHRDREHPHVHIVINRVDDQGKAYNLWQSYDRFMKGLREVERAYGLEPPRDRNRPYQPEPGERHRPVRDGELTWKLDATTRIGDAIHASDGTWESFVSELGARDVDLALNPNGRGITYGLKDRTDREGKPVRLKASTLGRRFRMDGIQQRLNQHSEALTQERRRDGTRFPERSRGIADGDPNQHPAIERANVDIAGTASLGAEPIGDRRTGYPRAGAPYTTRWFGNTPHYHRNAGSYSSRSHGVRGKADSAIRRIPKDVETIRALRDYPAHSPGRADRSDGAAVLDHALGTDHEGIFGGIRYAGCEGLSPEEQHAYRRAMAGYVAARKEHPAYQRADGNTVRQALAIERDLRALVHGRLLALAPKPELVERVQNITFVAGRLRTPEGAVDLVVNRLVSRGITRALEAAPAAVPLAVAVLVAKDVIGALNEISLSEQEKRAEIEDEHRHDREWQFVQEAKHEYEREW